MKFMKSIVLTLTSLVIFTAAATAAGKDWMTDIDSAVKVAKEKNKAVLVEFTGSDWCPPCIMMDKKVFSQSSFVSKASEDFILVKIDIPRSNPELSEKNSKVLNKYKVQGVPTVILMDKEGKEFNRFTASQFPEVGKFLAHLDGQLEKKDLN